MAGLPSRSPSDALLLALYRGPLEAPLWAEFLAQLRKELDVDFASLAFRKFDAPVDQTQTFIDTDTPRGGRRLDVLERVYKKSRFPFEDLPPDTPFLMEGMLNPNDPAHQAYLREYLHPLGHHHMLLMRTLEPGGSTGMLAISSRSRSIPEPAIGCFRALAPHLSISMRYLATIEQGNHRATISSSALHKVNFGTLTFGRGGGIIDLDQNASRLLGDARLLGRMDKGMIRLSLQRSRPETRAFLEDLGASTVHKSQVLHLSDDPSIDLLVLPVPTRMISGNRTPVAIGYVHGNRTLNPDQAEGLSKLFGLSRSEAALALILCNGRTIAEAAVELGITNETARTYSKRIYSKTGTRSQADLVRLVLASIIIIS